MVAHELHFPKAFRDALQREVDAYDRGTYDANGQRSYKHMTLQPHGGYYVQATVEGQNRYIGIFKRSVVGIYAIVMTRMNPTSFSDSGRVRRWVEMMINDDAVAAEWTLRWKRFSSPLAQKRPRAVVEELED